MEVIIHGDKLKITDAMDSYIKEKINKLDKYLEEKENVKATIIVKVNNKQQRVEITIPLKTFIIRSEEATDDFYAAVDKTIDKLERQIKKNKARMMSKKIKIMNDFDMLEIDNTEESTDKNKVIKRKYIDAKPMNEDEAILQMELLGHEFYMFTDSEKEKPAVVYKRKDGNYGIIEYE